MTASITLETMRTDIARMIHCNPDDIFVDDNLMDLGLDSMRAMNLVLLWQEQGLNLEFSELAENPTLGGCWQAAKRQLGIRIEA